MTTISIEQSANELVQKLAHLQQALDALQSMLREPIAAQQSEVTTPSKAAPRSAASKPGSGVIRLPGAYAGPAGFLWKPISDSDGKLAVLLPERMTGTIRRVDILSPDGSRVIEQGRNAGVGNGGREHFRFQRTGNGYPAEAIVQITHKDGSVDRIAIAKPAVRTEGRT